MQGNLLGWNGDAENGSWVDQTMLNSCEDELVKSTKIAYQSGKGNKLVSAMIQDDTVAAIKLLVYLEIRKKSLNPCGQQICFSINEIIFRPY